MHVVRDGTLTTVHDTRTGKRHHWRIEAKTHVSWCMQVAICIAEDVSFIQAIYFLDEMRPEIEENFREDWDSVLFEFERNWRSDGHTKTPRVMMD